MLVWMYSAKVPITCGNRDEEMKSASDAGIVCTSRLSVVHHFATIETHIIIVAFRLRNSREGGAVYVIYVT